MALTKKRARLMDAALDAKKIMDDDPSDENIKAASEAAEAVKSMDDRLAKAQAATAAMDALAVADPVVDAGGAPVAAKSLGDHFVKSAGSEVSRFRGGGRVAVSAPEFKAFDDPQLTTDLGLNAGGVLLTDVDRTIVKGPRRATITGLFGQGRISGNSIAYFVEGVREGDFEAVAEAGAMPQVHYELPEMRTDSLSKIAGFIKLSDEMLEDLDFLVSEINGRLVYDLSIEEEAQVISGDGLGANLEGLLNRNGVQVANTNAAGLADEIFKSMTRITNATGLDADALVINPVDYEGLRLAKDGNQQYMGGGYFQGQYGAGGFAEQPPVWGLRTVVTPAVAVNKPVVGAFNLGGTVYRKGGVSIEATNSDDTDFRNGLVTVRATERIALAVRRPNAFVAITVN